MFLEGRELEVLLTHEAGRRLIAHTTQEENRETVASIATAFVFSPTTWAHRHARPSIKKQAINDHLSM